MYKSYGTEQKCSKTTESQLSLKPHKSTANVGMCSRWIAKESTRNDTQWKLYIMEEMTGRRIWVRGVWRQRRTVHMRYKQTVAFDSQTVEWCASVSIFQSASIPNWNRNRNSTFHCRFAQRIAWLSIDQWKCQIPQRS